MLKRIFSFSKYLMPRKTKVYLQSIQELVLKIQESVDALEHLGGNEHPSKTAKRIKEIEEYADKIVHDLNTTLLYDYTRVTEEKGDIQVFLHNLDNIIDNIEGAAWRISNMEPNVLALQMRDNFIPLFKSTVRDISLAVYFLYDVSMNQDELSFYIKDINRNENGGDELYRDWLLRLVRRNFRDEGERLLLLEILERLEQVLDSAEDVADNLGTFMVKGGI